MRAWAHVVASFLHGYGEEQYLVRAGLGLAVGVLSSAIRSHGGAMLSCPLCKGGG